MSTEISDLLDAAAPAVTAVVQSVRDDQLDERTPCTEFTVRDLLNHLLQVAQNFQALAHSKEVDWAPGPDRLTGDWRAEFTGDVRTLGEVWSDPATLDGTSPGLGLPQRVVGMMLVVHAWDLAIATGQPYTVEPVLLSATGEFLDIMGDTGRQMGAFGPEVTAPDDSDAFAVLLARTGRDPRWQPAN
ncbi:TIGR03086 family protein [Actinoplanes sp. NEAU-A11]|uniref:TIGR03086 family protein n=1 Tax=Actinoplanes aureus TaxID=2792083 RepID=A0A931CDC6_9ACTN|nr:TIGR03086 family protein [Actinoplanes aureus]